MKKSTDKRKKYWENQYLEYWQDRVSKNSKSSLLRTDIRPAGLSVFNHYYNLAISYLDDKPPKIIDVGIGFGRFVSIYKRDFGNNIWGTDISEKMVNECKRLHPEIRQHLLTVPAECQPFLANFFSFIVCWAVFDATYQEKALWEFQRLLEPRGILLLTGKNTKYLSSDLKAIVAEKKAREKGHPNYFTRVDLLEKNISKFGFEIKRLFRFKERGDFSKNICTEKKIAGFYEFIMILEKIKTNRGKKPLFKIADKVSETYRKSITNYS